MFRLMIVPHRDIPWVAWLVCLAFIGACQCLHADEGAPPLHRQIDELIARRLVESGIAPAEISSDAEFLRRIYLDLTGVIPSAQQTRAFLDDTSPEKRLRLIDELLASPNYALHMSRVFDVMLIERRIPAISSYDVPSPVWRAYLAEAFAENRPWDRLIGEILSSDGTEGASSAAGVKFYLVRDVAPHQLTRDIGRLFLGIDLQCAQCHDDPRFAAYKQADYYGIFAFLQRTTAFRDSEKNVSLVGETAAGKTTFVSVFTAHSGETNPRLPGCEMIPDPVLEADKEYVVKPGPKDRGIPTYSRRKKLAEQLPRRETPGFSRNLANRLWALLMGRGIVHPVDLHHPDNLPSHPELLASLERWLVDHKYDIRATLREIALSQTYQRSSLLPGESSALPDNLFAVAPLRGLTAEQLSWSVLQATGRIEQHFKQLENQQKNTPSKSDENVPAWKVQMTQLEPLERQTRVLTAAFAGLPGQAEGDFQPIVDQALHLLNSPTMLPLVQDQSSPLLARLTEITAVDPLADEIYLSILSRRPDPDERAAVQQLVQATPSPAERREALMILVWGLLLSSEFRLNH